MRPESRRRWGRVFAIASLVTPVLLGVVIGALAWGRVQAVAGSFRTAFVDSWLGVFPVAVGFYTLIMVAFLAAVYATVDATFSTNGGAYPSGVDCSPSAVLRAPALVSSSNPNCGD